MSSTRAPAPSSASECQEFAEALVGIIARSLESAVSSGAMAMLPNCGSIASARRRTPRRSRSQYAEVLGISILYRDHEPPHFHARYGSHRITVGISDGHVTGDFPPRALRLVQEWRTLRSRELMDDWNRARNREPLSPIPPLE